MFYRGWFEILEIWVISYQLLNIEIFVCNGKVFEYDYFKMRLYVGNNQLLHAGFFRFFVWDVRISDASISTFPIPDYVYQLSDGSLADFDFGDVASNGYERSRA